MSDPSEPVILPKAGPQPGGTPGEYRRNRWTFPIGTIGRDMLYTLFSMFFLVYLARVGGLSDATYGAVTVVIVAIRVIDAVSDPLMGMIVDNTRTRWGKHKPWITIGALASGVITLAIFWDKGLDGAMYVVVFAVLYVLWSATYSLNDIAYWSYVPELSTDQKERENIGSKARIFALVGTFFVVATILEVTKAWGDDKRAWFLFAVVVVVVLWVAQAVTLFGVKEPPTATAVRPRTSFRDFVRAIGGNDQLLWIAISMLLFMVGYTTTVSMGAFYFTNVYGDVAMYSLFAIVLGVSQIVSLILVPLVAKKLSRATIYLIAMILVVAGYVIFFFAPTSTMLFIGIAGVLIFIGQAAIQWLILLSLADTVDYGHWKLGKRNDSVTFSIQPFIYKSGGAIASGVVGLSAIISGINQNPAVILYGAPLFNFKALMFLLPLVCILIGWVVYKAKFRIDETFYAKIHAELVERGDLVDEQ